MKPVLPPPFLTAMLLTFLLVAFGEMCNPLIL